MKSSQCVQQVILTYEKGKSNIESDDQRLSTESMYKALVDGIYKEKAG